MGLDIRLLPCEHWHEENGKVWGYSHTILDLGRVGSDAWNDFEVRVKSHLVPMPTGHNVSSFVGARVSEGYHQGESIYGKIRDKDAYGTPYTYVEAQYLLPWLAEHFRYNNSAGHGPYQTAIVAYVRTLPSDTKIILDWH